MGNTDSAEAKPAQSASPRPGKSKEKDKRLLDYYTVGEMLGQGTFGVVYACVPKGQDRECAVKMVDKVETPVHKIDEEVAFLRKMKHPNVIRCYDVIYEKCFVCIVMDRLQGGDLIMGMSAHWQASGRIPFAVSSRIAAQMASSLDYLHAQSMIHRDIKGDNYLTDIADITDEKCRIVLTDFGTGLELKPNQRLKDKCGTKLYWSPEFYKLDYSYPVDVWAMGVVCYGLICGKFPFKNETECNNKKLSFASETPAEAKDLAKQMLAKTEEGRIKAADVVKHPFLVGNKVNVPVEKEPAAKVKFAEEEPKEEPKEEHHVEAKFGQEHGADHGVQERRNELFDRLMQKAKSAFVKPEMSCPDGSHFWNSNFTIVDKRSKNAMIRYEWWTEAHVTEDVAGLRETCGTVEKLAGKLNEENSEQASLAVIKKQLEDHNIDTSKFGVGQAKGLSQLVSEIASGSAVLMLDATEHKKLVRVVELVALRIHAPGRQMMIETSEKFPDGRSRTTNRLPGTKKGPHENTRQTCERIVKDMMNLGKAKLSFDFKAKESFEKREDSVSYPGVTTVYRTELVDGSFEDSESLCEESIKTDSKGNTKIFNWKDIDTCKAEGIEFQRPEGDDGTSALVNAPVGMNEEDLIDYLTRHKVDIAQFGVDKAKTLEEYSKELLSGTSSLVQDTDSSLIRIVDVVLLKLLNSKKEILVQASQMYEDQTEVKLTRLPGTKRRLDENVFFAARRIISRDLQIDENNVTCNARDVESVEEEKQSLAYPGLRTVYRKRIVVAVLEAADETLNL